MTSIINFREANKDNLNELANFYSQIKEYGKKNIIADHEHLIWKHFDNPEGKSLIATIQSDDEIRAAMIFQRNKKFSSKNEFKYFLASDMAFKQGERKLSNVLNFWDACDKFIKQEFPEFAIVHSSNIKSEPIYNKYFTNFKITTIDAKIYFPLSIRNKYTLLENLDSNYKFNDWRWSKKSKIEYRILKNRSTGDPEIIYRIQKKFGIRILIIIEVNPTVICKNKFKLSWQLLVLCLKEKCIIPIFYLELRNNNLVSPRNDFIKIPHILSKYKFPIYVRNDPKNIASKLNIIQLSILDVL
jgi:hypothetical protein